MKKIVPDPPPRVPRKAGIDALQTATQAIRQTLANQPPTPLLQSLKSTVARPTSALSPFAVRAGIGAEEALAHIARLLKCAEEVCDEITEQGSGIEPGLVWSVTHSVEMARALVLALLDGAEVA